MRGIVHIAATVLVFLWTWNFHDSVAAGRGREEKDRPNPKTVYYLLVGIIYLIAVGIMLFLIVETFFPGGLPSYY